MKSENASFVFGSVLYISFSLCVCVCKRVRESDQILMINLLISSQKIVCSLRGNLKTLKILKKNKSTKHK